MESEGMIRNSQIGKLLLLTGAVYFFLKFLAPLISPILLAALFVTIFGPFLQKLQERLKINRQFGSVILLLIACTLSGLLFWVLFYWIAGSLPQWMEGMEAVETKLLVLIHRLCELGENVFRTDTASLERSIVCGLEDSLQWLRADFMPDVLAKSPDILRSMLKFGAFLVCFVIAVLFLAKDYDDIMNRMLEREECHMLLEIICGVIHYIATFVRAQVIIISCIGGLSAAVLWLARVPSGVFWGIMAGILDALPFIGTGIVLIPLAISRFLAGAYGGGVVCLGLYVVCIFIRELLEPKLIGRKTGISPIAILLSIYAGVQLFGVWGILEGPLGFVIIREAWRSSR